MITSRDNERLKLVRKLRARRWRDRLGLFVAEGEDLVDAARAAGIEPVELLEAGETVDARLLADVSTLGHAARLVAVFRREDLPHGQLRGVGVGLWRVGDPGNVGTLVRAADAFGPGYVALSPGSADPVSPKALRASAGAIFRVPLASFDEAPRPWVALVPRGVGPLWEIEVPVRATFVLGAERGGLPADVLARCDGAATIPLAPHADSLNVAMAGVAALYEARRTRDYTRVMATISGVWTSPAKNSGTMTSRESARAVAGHGLEGCAHARADTKRQVLFASKEHLDALGLEPGRIRENFTVDGADVHAWPVGRRVRAGGAVFEISMECEPCERMEAIRPGLQSALDGRRGMLARVIESGDVSVGDTIELL